MDVHGLFALLVLASFSGDNTNYWIGRYVGPCVFKRERSRFFNPAHIERTQRFYEKHGGYYFGNIPVVKYNLTLFILGIIVVSIMPGNIEFMRRKLGNAKN